MTMKIIPMNEPHGEGNGWHECLDEAEGVMFCVDNGHEIIQAFDTRDEAESYARGEFTRGMKP